MKGGRSEVEYLTDRVNEHQAQLKKERRRQESKSPKEWMAEEVPAFLKTFDFWCITCQEDFSAPAFRSESSFDGHLIVLIRATHEECGEESIRFGTQKDEDPYYNKSAKVQEQRDRFAADFLSPEDYGFKATYNKDAYEQFNKDLREKEEQVMREERDLGLKGTTPQQRQKLKRIRSQA